MITKTLADLQPGDIFQYIGADEWHKVSRTDDTKLYYPVGQSEQSNYRTGDVPVYVQEVEVSHA